MNELWALPFEMAESVLMELARAKATPEKPQARLEGLPGQGNAGYAVVDGVAVIPVSGTLTRTTEYSQWSGKALSQGQDVIEAQIKNALTDTSVRAILFDIDSPGGVVAGTKELADAIAEARTQKRCAAYANGLCASAAYWLASATGMIYAPQTATVGSIGVIMTITNTAKLEEKWGIATVTITGGKWKAAGQGTLTDEERQYFQERINTLHSIFKADVSRHMELTADPAAWGEGQLLLAQSAADLGLVTAIVRDRDGAIRKLAQEANMTREELQAQAPELVQALLAEGKLKAEADNRTALETACANAVAGALGVFRAVAGEAVSAKAEAILYTCTKTGMSAEQIATIAPLLAKADAPTAPVAPVDTEAQSRAAILAGIQAAQTAPVNASAETIVKTPNPLLADATRRAGR